MTEFFIWLWLFPALLVQCFFWYYIKLCPVRDRSEGITRRNWFWITFWSLVPFVSTIMVIASLMLYIYFVSEEKAWSKFLGNKINNWFNKEIK